MITILLPVYNGVEYLDKCIESIKSQTYEDWVLFIGVNGHSYNSVVYRKAAKYEGPKIKVFDLHQVRGKAKTLNTLLTFVPVRSTHVALIDVDDLWHMDKLKEQSKYMDKYDVVGTNCRYFGESSSMPLLPFGDLGDFDFRKYNPIINSSALIKKELCHWEGNILEDYDMWLRLWRNKKKFYNIEYVLTYHMIHKDSHFNIQQKEQDLAMKELKRKYF